MLEKIGHRREEIETSLKERRYDDIMATYLLFLRQDGAVVRLVLYALCFAGAACLYWFAFYKAGVCVVCCVMLLLWQSTPPALEPSAGESTPAGASVTDKIQPTQDIARSTTSNTSTATVRIGIASSSKERSTPVSNVHLQRRHTTSMHADRETARANKLADGLKPTENTKSTLALDRAGTSGDDTAAGETDDEPGAMGGHVRAEGRSKSSTIRGFVREARSMRHSREKGGGITSSGNTAVRVLMLKLNCLH